MQFPEEKKRPTCRHDPKQWTDCPRCVEDFYLEHLNADPTPLMSDATRDALARYSEEGYALPHSFARLRELVEVRPCGSASAPAFVGRGRVFSTTAEGMRGTSEEAVVEDIILNALSALEAEKAALELKSAMLERELERTKATLLASEYEAEQHETSWRLACADRQREVEHRRALRKSILMREGESAATAARMADEELPKYPQPAPPTPPWSVRHPDLGPSMLTALRSAVTRADAAETEAQRLREAKDEVYAERNELAALVARMAQGCGLATSFRADDSGDEGFQTLLFVQLPQGQVSWHLPDHERPLLDGLPTFQAAWDGHTTPEKRRRIHEAIFAGFHPPRRGQP